MWTFASLRRLCILPILTSDVKEFFRCFSRGFPSAQAHPQGKNRQIGDKAECGTGEET
jgi:hypothetical protein